jgi:hypothetical protein
MGTKHPMSPNSSRLIKLYNSHCPFASSCSNIDIFSISFPMQTTNHPLVTLLILTNHAPTTSAPYQPPTLHVNEGSQPYTFLNPLDHVQLEHSPPPPFYWSLHWPWSYPPPTNLPHFFQHTFNLHLKSCVPLMGANLLVEGYFIINFFVRHLIHPIQTLVIILAQYPPLLPLHMD